MVTLEKWRCANTCEPCECVCMNLMLLGDRRVARLGSYPIYISSGHIYRRSYPNQVPERTTLDGCYPTETSTLVLKGNGCVRECVGECVYQPNPKIVSALKLEVRKDKTHASHVLKTETIIL